MKKSSIPVLLGWALLFLVQSVSAQQFTLVCNDLVQISVDQNCSYTIQPEDILEGTLYPNCIVELDRIAPFGNGPWTTPVLGPADINKTYQVRVTHVPSGNKCWGSLKAEDKLPPQLDCDNISLVELTSTSLQNVPLSALNVVADDNCSAATVTPASLIYNCQDQGLKTVTFTATDAYGNSSTCQHSILVTHPTNCEPCVSECPPSVTVSFEQGNNVLLPAFQNNNWSAFDVYGNALYDPACQQIDSTYGVTYQATTTNTAYFLRQWLWVDPAFQFIPCKQYILFPKTHEVTVQGKVFVDADLDCVNDAGELGLKIYPVKVTKLPSNTSQILIPNAQGQYNTTIVFDTQDAGAEVSLLLPAGVNTICPNTLSIPNVSAVSNYQFDIGLQTGGNCPVMEVDLGHNFMRRCMVNAYTLNYCNTGLDTAYNAYVNVKLDSLIELQSASSAYTTANGIHTFQLGTVPPFSCGTIYLYGKVSCNAQLGQTLCNEATIYPNTPCSGIWSGVEVEASAVCEGDSVALSLRNVSQQDMTQPLNYIVIEDFIMYKDGNFQLNAGETFTIKTNASGATWRIEADQVPDFPVDGGIAAAVEGCGGLNTSGLLNAFGLTTNSNSYDQDCGIVTGSYDPNDKSAVPTGIQAEHYLRANEEIEYKIRFQNTGTDTAFKVVIVDTLPAQLDLSTLRAGVASHPYQLKIYPGGILHFVFDPIALPDSNVNEAASNGFVQFRIAQQPDLPDGTLIENSAAIYFDFNAPVITNTYRHTIGYPFEILPPLVISAQSQSPTCNGAANGTLILTPTGGKAPYTYAWANPALQGASLSGLAAGMYQFTLTDAYGNSLVQVYELTQPDVLQADFEVVPTTIGENNGAVQTVVVGGTQGYTFLWNTGATTADLDQLSAGAYTLTITDANGCTRVNEVVVGQVAAPLVFSANFTHPTCFGMANGAIQVIVSGGTPPYNYQWNDPALQGGNPVNLPAGTYTVTLTDSANETYIQDFELTQPTQIEVSSSTTNSLNNLDNGTATVTVSGGSGNYTYAWNTGAQTASISGLAAGTYSVVVTDALGCSVSISVNVLQSITTPFVSGPINQTNISCFGGSDGAIEVFASGGLLPYTYQWSLPNLQGNHPTGLSAGVYTFTISDNLGQSLEQTITLNDPIPVFLSSLNTPTIANQNTGSATIVASGGAGNYTYLWNTGATSASINNLAAGVYTVVVTDGNGCTETDEVTVESVVSTEQPDWQARVRVWPNPAQEYINVDLAQVLSEVVRLDVLASDGRLLRQYPAKELQAVLQMPVEPNFPAGFIFLALHTRNGETATWKIARRN
jgi:uncharacterized repeat protein (TIGR01451 family)